MNSGKGGISSDWFPCSAAGRVGDGEALDKGVCLYMGSGEIGGGLPAGVTSHGAGVSGEAISARDVLGRSAGGCGL